MPALGDGAHEVGDRAHEHAVDIGGAVALDERAEGRTRRRYAARWLPVEELRVGDLLLSTGIGASPGAASGKIAGQTFVILIGGIDFSGKRVAVIGTGATAVMNGTVFINIGHPVFLDLKVKARPKWRRDEAMLERLGI